MIDIITMTGIEGGLAPALAAFAGILIMRQFVFNCLGTLCVLCGRDLSIAGEGSFYSAGEPVRKLLAVAGDGDAEVRLVLEPPGGVELCDKLALTVTRGHKDHETFAGAVRNTFEHVDDVFLKGRVEGVMRRYPFEPGTKGGTACVSRWHGHSTGGFVGTAYAGARGA